MVYIVFVYLLYLLFSLIRKNRGFTMSSVVVALFSLSVLCGVMIDVWNLYGEYGVNEKTASLSATLVFCLGIWAIVRPFRKLDQANVQYIAVRKRRLLDGLCWLFVLAFVANLAVKGTDIITSIIEDAASVKSEHYEDLDALVLESSQPIYMYFINMLVGSWSLILCLWFYRMIFLPKSYVLNMLLLLSSLGGIFNSFALAGRAAIIYWLFVFFLFFSFFKKFMGRKLEKRILLIFCVLGGYFGVPIDYYYVPV